MNYNFPSVMKNTINPVPPISAVGYRFHPTNEELIKNYLKPKITGDDVEDLRVIAEVNVCRYEPWDLPDISIIKSDDAVWYFFCPRDFKYKNSQRSNRKTKEGFWKPTGKSVEIRDKRTKKVIGIKKTLVFHERATPKAVRTKWIIHEYEYICDSSLSNRGGYVLIKLKKKSDGKTRKGETNHLRASISDFEAEPSCSMASDQNHSELTVNSACVESASSNHLASDFENQNSNELMSNSAYDGSVLCHSMTSNYEHQYPKEQIVNSASNGYEQRHLMFSDHENQEPIEMSSMSPSDNCIMASDFEVPLSPFQLEGECDPSMQMPSKLINYSTFDKGTGSSLLDFENQNQNKKTDISAPNEGERSSFTMPWDFGNQNPWEKIDMSTLEECCFPYSTVSPENSPADASLPEFPEVRINLRCIFFLISIMWSLNRRQIAHSYIRTILPAAKPESIGRAGRIPGAQLKPEPPTPATWICKR